MLTISSVLVGTATAGGCTNATSQNWTVWTYGAGAFSCGKWSEEHPNGSTSVTLQNSEAHQWMLGYISGRAAVSPQEKTDADAIVAWVTNHCADYPLETIEEAGNKLASALMKR